MARPVASHSVQQMARDNQQVGAMLFAEETLIKNAVV